MARVQVTHFTDPGCPWAYSASPALAALRWRFGDQLEWRHVMIGLTEHASQYAERGYTPLMMARGQMRFRRFGMPFAPQVKGRVAGTSRACRAIVAARLQAPEQEWAVLRALQFMQFTTGGLLDSDDDLAAALAGVPGVDAHALVDAIDSPEVLAAYETDRAEARTAAGGPTEAQGKTAATDGPVRYTAPSLVFSLDEGGPRLDGGATRLEAGGFQSLMVYDALLANLDPALERRDPPQDVALVLGAFPHGLTTAELAEVYASGAAQETARDAIEDRLVELAGQERVVRVPLGDDALWLAGAAVDRGGRDASGRLAAA